MLLISLGVNKKVQARPYQIDFNNGIYHAWDAGARNVLGVLPTGSGKTFCFSDIVKNWERGASVAIAHRQELISQIALAYARMGIEHCIIGPHNVIRFAIQRQEEELGLSTYNVMSNVFVIGIDTLRARASRLTGWAKRITLWIMDEAHHLLLLNKWGKGIEMFPNALGLGVTAVARRADGKGLGKTSHGVMDHLLVGPSMRELINQGYLCDYDIWCPPSNYQRPTDDVSRATGDWTNQAVTESVHNSTVVGDVVQEYLKIASGKLGVTFTPNVETAEQIANEFRTHGVSAVTISYRTPDADRARMLRAFRHREIMQLVSVDIFGEGFDLPAVEVASFARPTASYLLFVQQFGRALRTNPGKGRALIIDHVGNVIQHGLPDAPQAWTLEPRYNRTTGPDGTAITVCTRCAAGYKRGIVECPYCGYVAPPSERSGPVHVDGDLIQLDAETLAYMREAVEGNAESAHEYTARLHKSGLPVRYVQHHARAHARKLLAIDALREIMGWWAGLQSSRGLTDSSIQYREFYKRYGVDVLTAQTLDREATTKLAERITGDLL